MTGSRIGRLVAAVSALAILGWVVPALLMLGRGFTVQDEGTYVLSYRWWASNPYFSLGSQYVYGPVFEAFGESIPALRALRLVMVLAANAWFGRTFVTWLAHHRGLVLSRGTQVAATLLLVACGGLTYLWSPLTPGYYDLVTDLGLAMAALFFSLLARLPRVPWWVPFVSGALSFVLVVTKWPAVLVVLVSQAGALVVVAGVSRRQAGRYAGILAAGFAAAALLTQVFVFRLADVLPVIRDTSRLAAAGGHGPADLLGMYASTALQFGLAAALFAVPALAAYVVAVRNTSLPTTTARALVVGGLAVTGLGIPLAAGWHGGDGRGRVVVAVILASLLTATVAAALPRARAAQQDDRRVSVVALVVLVVLPLGQAVGSDVPWVYLAGTCLAMWVAAVALVATAAPRPGIGGFTVVAGLVAVALEVAMISGTTTLMTPFHAGSLRSDTTTVDGLRGLRVPATEAREYDALRAALAPYVVRGRTPMFTVGRIAGLTYLLDGKPVGPTWTDASHPQVLADTLALACRDGDAPPDQPPVLLLDRQPDPVIVTALTGCGFDFPEGYRSLPVPGGPRDIRVFVPTAAVP